MFTDVSNILNLNLINLDNKYKNVQFDFKLVNNVYIQQSIILIKII